MRDLTGRMGLALIVGMAILPPAGASGAVTVGSDLGRAPTGNVCGGGCTVSQSGLSAASQTAGGLFSPVTGTITEWRIRTGPATSPTALRVIRRDPVPGFLTALSTSGTVTPPSNAIATYPTNLPIRAGDNLGVNCCASGAGDYFVPGTGQVDGFFGALGDGETAEPDFTSPSELAVNADVEPSSQFSLRGATPVGGGAVQLTLGASNPGTISVTGKGPKVAVAAAGKRRVRYLRPTTLAVRGFIVEQVLVQPTNSALRVLHHLKRPRVLVSVTFTPMGGAPSAPQFDSVRLGRCPACPPPAKRRR